MRCSRIFCQIASSRDSLILCCVIVFPAEGDKASECVTAFTKAGGRITLVDKRTAQQHVITAYIVGH